MLPIRSAVQNHANAGIEHDALAASRHALFGISDLDVHLSDLGDLKVNINDCAINWHLISCDCSRHIYLIPRVCQESHALCMIPRLDLPRQIDWHPTWCF